jgi:hypothetical protein
MNDIITRPVEDSLLAFPPLLVLHSIKENKA